MLSQKAIQKILSIKEEVYISPNEMADKLNITFYPYDKEKISKNILNFKNKLERTLNNLKANIVPFEESLKIISIRKVFLRVVKIYFNNLIYIFSKIFRHEVARYYIPFGVIKNSFKRKRIKSGISVIALQESTTGNLPMDNTSSFSKSSVITILDWPNNINNHSNFHEHFDIAMSLFARHMTNIIIGVTDKKWLLYNFNASHPIYNIDVNFKENILNAFIPKIVAPIRPVKFNEFKIKKDSFNTNDNLHRPLVRDMLKSGSLLEDTELYPKGKKIDDLPFRNNYYRWIGKLHLDHRNGMSYGFLARQLPIEIPEVLSLKQTRQKYQSEYSQDKDYFYIDNQMYILIDLADGSTVSMKVPDVWVLSQKSGCDKIHMNPEKDLVKMGLVNGEMFLQPPKGLKLNNSYKTSFDTKVILAHAIGNAISAAIFKYLNINIEFVRNAEKNGFSITHWHGYISSVAIPKKWHIHGLYNPHVACSSPQSAIYALSGKLQAMINSIENNEEYCGDIHIEPHHGSNMTHFSLKHFSDFLHENPNATCLGNKHLDLLKM